MRETVGDGDGRGFICNDGTTNVPFKSLKEVAQADVRLSSAVERKAFDAVVSAEEYLTDLAGERKLEDTPYDVQTTDDSWTRGDKRALMIYICFESHDCSSRESAFSSGHSGTQADFDANHAKLEQFFAEQSYGKSTVTVTEVPGVVTLPASMITDTTCAMDAAGDEPHLDGWFDAVSGS